MTTPLDRIADALEVLALHKLARHWSRDIEDIAEDHRPTWRVVNALRERIEARHAAAQQTPTLCSFGCGRVATETANGEPECSDGDACVDMKRDGAPGPAYVSGGRLRIGDVLIDGRRVVSIDAERWPVVESGARLTPERVYFVRLPRPAAEPSAKVKCATCRCMIVRGSTCACCESTSGDDPPLPSLDRDEEPSASGEGIARADHLCITVSYGAGSYTWTAHNEGEAASVAASINAAHAHATRELRERCERAERESDEVRAALFSCATLRDEYEREHGVAIARAEAAERVVRAAKQIGSVTWSTAPAAMRVIDDALDVYDAARKAST